MFYIAAALGFATMGVFAALGLFMAGVIIGLYAVDQEPYYND